MKKLNSRFVMFGICRQSHFWNWPFRGGRTDRSRSSTKRAGSTNDGRRRVRGCRQHRRRGDQFERPGSRRLGDRGNQRFPDQVPQDRGHRRSGPVTCSPQLPKAKYKVWVRGYGSGGFRPGRMRAPGQTLALKAVVAPDPRAAAQYYPPNYWLSMLNIPAKDQFPMKLAGGGKVVPTQGDWIDLIKTGCQTCHQLGDKMTREMPKNLGTFPSTKAAWERRILSSQVGGNMVARLNAFDYDRGIAMFADWTDRITAGEVPPTPPRPAGHGTERRPYASGTLAARRRFSIPRSPPTDGIPT